MKNLFYILIIFGFSNVVIAGNLCETSFDKEVGAVSKAMSDQKNQTRWQIYEKFLNKFAECLDGSYAETIQGISEDALAKDWNGFISFAKKSKPVEKVLINIESGFSEEMGLAENLKKIKENAKQTCPSEIKNFCNKILKTKL